MLLTWSASNLLVANKQLAQSIWHNLTTVTVLSKQQSKGKIIYHKMLCSVLFCSILFYICVALSHIHLPFAIPWWCQHHLHSIFCLSNEQITQNTYTSTSIMRKRRMESCVISMRTSWLNRKWNSAHIVERKQHVDVQSNQITKSDGLFSQTHRHGPIPHQLWPSRASYEYISDTYESQWMS